MWHVIPGLHLRQLRWYSQSDGVSTTQAGLLRTIMHSNYVGGRPAYMSTCVRAVTSNAARLAPACGQ